MTNFLTSIDELLLIPAIISAAIGLGLMLISLLQLRKRRILAGGVQGLVALTLVSVGGLFLSLGLNLYTYHRFTIEQDIAEITFWQAGPQQYLAVLTRSDVQGEQNFMLYGDEWQIDARILKWTAPATLAGLDSRYRLERLSGRYRDLRQEREQFRSVYELSSEPGLAIWPVLARLNCCIDWVDTYFGNSAYLPMADQARYNIVLTQTGLVARPLNQSAIQAVQNWN